MSTVLRLLRETSLREWMHHPWRTATAVLAVALGVALAFSVHLINASALGEFSAAVRQVNAQPDFELRGQRGGFDEALLERVATHPGVATASPVVEVDTDARDPEGRRVAVRVLGVDALSVFALAPQLGPRPREGAPRLAAIDPAFVFPNAAAARRLLPGPAPAAGETPAEVPLLVGTRWHRFAVQGSVAVDGPPVIVMDIAGAQAVFDRLGRLSRIDVRLVPGADRDAVLRDLALPAGVRVAAPDESAQRVSNLSRAYRVNLTVLALVALFTGGFLVFSILALSVAQRLPQLALMGVLGLSARQRLGLVLAESATLGVVGAVLGLLTGTALAALALRLLGGDLGGAYFPGVTPSLRWSVAAAGVYGGLGVIAALTGGWVPARTAARLAPAQALKGLGSGGPDAARGWRAWGGAAAIAVGTALAFLPPIAGLPLAAYASVALLLLGGIACVPVGVGLLLARIAPSTHPLWLLALERARHQRDSATIAVAGVVASLSLSVALTVMVTSFRGSVIDWLDTVLPADLYARTATSAAAADAVYLDPAVVARASALAGVERVEALRVAQVILDPARPPVTLIARPLADPARDLPLTGPLHPASAAPAGDPVPIYVSEAMVDLYGARPGTALALPLPDGRTAPVWVRGVWRDYARQHGAVAIAQADFVRLTGDRRVNDLGLWLTEGTDPAVVQAAIRAAAAQVAGLTEADLAAGAAAPVEFAAPGEIRAISLRIFDRSFAVTYWLQAVAIGIGLFGIAASFSAQVLARRKEFGLLSHLGLTRRQVLTVVAAEGAAWTAAGALLGLLLGLAVSVVLVHVVNPQSFHWSMDLRLPVVRLAALALAVVAAGTLTAWWAGRAAARRDLALAVKEDW
jgi:putative ABC transport system permease protein